MPAETTAPGCRDTAMATGMFLAAAVALTALGLGLINRGECTGMCETVGLASLYAGGPISAILGVVFGGVHLAWPLDVTFWVAAGFLTARWSDRQGRSAVRAAVFVLFLALVYGLVLSRLVELDIPASDSTT